MVRRARESGWWPANLELERSLFVQTDLGRAPVIETMYFRKSPGHLGTAVLQFRTRGAWRHGKARKMLGKSLLLACPGMAGPGHKAPEILGECLLDRPGALVAASKGGVVRVESSLPISRPFPHWLATAKYLTMARAALARVGRPWTLRYVSLRKYQVHVACGATFDVTREILLSAEAGNLLCCSIVPKRRDHRQLWSKVQGSDWMKALGESFREHFPGARVRTLWHSGHFIILLDKSIVPRTFARDIAMLAGWRFPSLRSNTRSGPPSRRCRGTS